MKDHSGARCLPSRRVNTEFGFSCRFPMSRLVTTRLASNHLNPISNDERGIETNTELTDQLAVFLLIATELLHKGRCSRLCNSAQILDDIVA